MPKPLQWFRLHAEFATDPVVQSLAFEDQRHFVMLLCFKASGLLDRQFGQPQRRTDVIRKALGLDGKAWDEAVNRLAECGLIEGDLHPSNWDKRQYVSDSSAERTREYRKRMKRHGDVTVTPPETETETETETEKVKVKRKREEARATRFTLDSAPKEWVAFCKEERPDLNPKQTFANFADYWKAVPGTRGRKLDWYATWRNWVRNERAGKGSSVDVAELVAELEREGK